VDVQELETGKRYDGMVCTIDGQSPQRRIDGLLIRGCAPGDVAAVRDLGLSWRLERVRMRA